MFRSFSNAFVFKGEYFSPDFVLEQPGGTLCVPGVTFHSTVSVAMETGVEADLVEMLAVASSHDPGLPMVVIGGEDKEGEEMDDHSLAMTAVSGCLYFSIYLDNKVVDMKYIVQGSKNQNDSKIKLAFILLVSKFNFTTIM